MMWTAGMPGRCDSMKQVESVGLWAHFLPSLRPCLGASQLCRREAHSVSGRHLPSPTPALPCPLLTQAYPSHVTFHSERDLEGQELLR